MSSAAIQTTPRWKSISVWTLKALLALAFLAAGGAKLSGAPMMVETFEHIGLGQWFRYLTGALEVAGAIALLIPSVAAFGALLLCCIMVGAVITHVVIGGSVVPAIALLLMSATIASIHRSQIDDLFDALTGGKA
jgi:uncharacterized membrane protein YphA (DoxX/SURF4 family)